MTDALTILLTLSGTAFFLAGSVGLLRFPDLFSRLHALTKADNLGLGLIALGVLIRADSPAFAAKVALVWVVTLVASAAVSHLIARAALASAPAGVLEDNSGDRDHDVAR